MRYLEVGETVTLRRHIVAKILAIHRRGPRILVSYEKKETGEVVEEWVNLEEVETW